MDSKLKERKVKVPSEILQYLKPCLRGYELTPEERIDLAVILFEMDDLEHLEDLMDRFHYHNRYIFKELLKRAIEVKKEIKEKPLPKKQKGRKVIYQNRKLGIQAYCNKFGLYEILVWGKNIQTFDGETEFKIIEVFPKKLRLISIDGKEICLPFDTPEGVFLKGESTLYLVSPSQKRTELINEELLKNYPLN
jgi:hypothetical protein